jgi:hypothetical protein
MTFEDISGIFEMIFIGYLVALLPVGILMGKIVKAGSRED